MSRQSFAAKTGFGVAAGALNRNPRALGASERLDDAIAAKGAPAIQQAQVQRLQTVRDFRRVLDDKDIDAVLIETPDHSIGLLDSREARTTTSKSSSRKRCARAR